MHTRAHRVFLIDAHMNTQREQPVVHTPHDESMQSICVLAVLDLVTTRQRASCLQRSPLCFTRADIVCCAYKDT
jgi:hypothetical protein